MKQIETGIFGNIADYGKLSYININQYNNSSFSYIILLFRKYPAKYNICIQLEIDVKVIEL